MNKLLALVLATGMAAGTTAMAKEKIVMDGSTTVGPIAKAFAGYYEARNSDVSVTVSETGSGNGAKSLIDNSCHIANMSRFMKDKEFKSAVAKGIQPVAHAVAMDGIAIVVHSSNPVGELSVEQVRKIYKGEITNWKKLGGPDLKIVKISRDTSSGTFETFNKLIMTKQKIKDAEYVQSNGAARSRVTKTPGAIGYVGIGFLDGVKALTIDGVDVSEETVASGKYPVSRPLFMFTNGYPELGSHVHGLITLHLTPAGQEIVKGIGFVPVTKY